LIGAADVYANMPWPVRQKPNLSTFLLFQGKTIFIDVATMLYTTLLGGMEMAIHGI
jgi:hypothetical protein